MQGKKESLFASLRCSLATEGNQTQPNAASDYAGDIIPSVTKATLSSPGFTTVPERISQQGGNFTCRDLAESQAESQLTELS